MRSGLPNLAAGMVAFTAASFQRYLRRYLQATKFIIVQASSLRLEHVRLSF
jgi:hypothetical protein